MNGRIKNHFPFLSGCGRRRWGLGWPANRRNAERRRARNRAERTEGMSFVIANVLTLARRGQ